MGAKVIGRIYGPIGTIEFDEETGLLHVSVTDPSTARHICAIVRRINDDLKNNLAITTATEDSYIIGRFPSDIDLDHLMDSISLDSGGQLIGRHDSLMLDHYPEAESGD